MRSNLITLINKALGLVYDTMHPMPKVEISRILSEIKMELFKMVGSSKFTKEAQHYMEHSTNPHWSDLATYLVRACNIIDQLVPVCPVCGDINIDIKVDIENFGGQGIFVPVHFCKVCTFAWTDDIGGQVWDKNRALLKEANEIALKYRQAFKATREKFQERCMEISDQREKVAKLLHIDVNKESWWDLLDRKKDEWIEKAIKILKYGPNFQEKE